MQTQVVWPHPAILPHVHVPHRYCDEHGHESSSKSQECSAKVVNRCLSWQNPTSMYFEAIKGIFSKDGPNDISHPHALLPCDLALPTKKRGLFSHLPSICEQWLLWPIGYSRSDAVIVPSVPLRQPGSFRFLPHALVDSLSWQPAPTSSSETESLLDFHPSQTFRWLQPQQ